MASTAVLPLLPGHVLNVAEKPSVAEAISHILSRGAARKREGRARYNKVFEFPYTTERGVSVQMTVSSVLGHIMSLDFDKKYRGWNSCHPKALFDAPVFKRVSEVGFVA